jgi:uncharacterized protein YbjT (DUF2867 family)
VTALVRRTIDISDPKLIQRVIDFGDIETHGTVLEADDVFCCLGTTIKQAGTQHAFRKVDFDYVVKLAALSEHCGAKQFLVVSSLGANAHSRIFYNRVKGEMEEALRKIPFNAVHIFRPSLLLGTRREERANEKAGAIFMSMMKFAMTGYLKKYRAILARDVARAMVIVAQKDLYGVNIFESERIQEIANTIF